MRTRFTLVTDRTELQKSTRTRETGRERNAMLLPEKRLPQEVTELILLCLPFPELRETVPFVCKSWAECVQVSPTGLGLEMRLILNRKFLF